MSCAQPVPLARGGAEQALLRKRRRLRGFTAVGLLEAASGDSLVCGTSGGHLCRIDLQRVAVVSDWHCVPLAKWQVEGPAACVAGPLLVPTIRGPS
jgi:hypothetical protein